MRADPESKVGGKDRGPNVETQGLRVAQIQQLYSQVRPGMFGALVAGAALPVALWDAVPHWRLVVWLACFMVAQVPRHLLMSAFRKAQPAGEDAIPWGRWFVIASGVTALLWGATPIFLFPADSILHQFLLALFLVGVASSTAVAHSPVTESYLPSIVLTLVPLCGRFVYEGGRVELTIGILTLLFMAVLIATGKRMHAINTESLRLRFENDDLIESLTEHKTRTDALNEDLRVEIGQRERAESALQRARDDLELRVEKRTQELQLVNEELTRQIEERERAEEELRKSEEKYRMLVENANEAILVAQDGMLRLVNSRAVEIMGYEEEELTSGVFVRFIHPDDQEMVVERHKRRMEGESLPNVYSFRVIDRSGNVKLLEINAVAINWEGRPATLNFVSDITARRRMDEELHKIEKLQSLGILAGGIAHDFNNILTAIQGNIGLAKLSSDSPGKVVERLTEAEKACLRAQGLTHQLLTFSRGGSPIKKAALISEIIKDSCAFALRGSNVRCEFFIPDDLWTVEVDVGQISQVIHNLIINADHAMPEGGSIHVLAENVAISSEDGLPLKEGKYLRLVVKDQGCGIPENVLPRIFDPYFTTKHKGSGLGLGTSYSIIKNHEGFITAESETGVGTTFHIYLPASQKKMSALRDSERPAPAGKGRILLMDDEDLIRDLAGAMLSVLGYEVELAGDGDEAVELFQVAIDSSRPFDAVILDLTVPGGMGAKEAIQRLREIDPSVKAMVSSGYSNDPIMADYESHGFNGVVAKPYTPEEMSDALNQLMERVET